MGVVEDVRKVIQDLVAPELKSLAAEIAAGRHESKMRDDALAQEAKSRDEVMLARLETLNTKLEAQNTKLEALSNKMDGKMDALSNKMDYQYASLMNALNLDKRGETLERERHTASA